MNAFVIDTETTGVSHENDVVIEIAGALIDTDANCFIASYATLIHNDANPAEHVNKISVQALANSFAAQVVLDPFIALAESADVIIAHNAAFDRPFVNKLLAAHGRPPITKPWVCTVTQIKFPHEYNSQHISATGKFCRKLTHLASDYNISAAGAHRAMMDVQILGSLLLKIEKIGPFCLEEQVKNALAPKKWFMAIVELPWTDEGKSKDLAKAAGFRFEFKTKRWLKELSEAEAKKMNIPNVKLSESDIPEFD